MHCAFSWYWALAPHMIIYTVIIQSYNIIINKYSKTYHHTISSYSLHTVLYSYVSLQMHCAFSWYWALAPHMIIYTVIIQSYNIIINKYSKTYHHTISSYNIIIQYHHPLHISPSLIPPLLACPSLMLPPFYINNMCILIIYLIIRSLLIIYTVYDNSYYIHFFHDHIYHLF